MGEMRHEHGAQKDSAVMLTRNAIGPSNLFIDYIAKQAYHS
jgi:hypothetical protein